MNGISHKKAIALAPIALLLSAQTVATAELPALAQLEKGKWQLSNPIASKSEPGEEAESICLGDPMLLMKLEHPGVTCSHEVIASAANSGSVHYTCPGRGFGRTSIRVETPRLVKIDTQGMASNHPFAYRVEARRVGAC
jgi:hypothetical protein